LSGTSFTAEAVLIANAQYLDTAGKPQILRPRSSASPPHSAQDDNFIVEKLAFAGFEEPLAVRALHKARAPRDISVNPISPRTGDNQSANW